MATFKLKAFYLLTGLSVGVGTLSSGEAQAACTGPNNAVVCTGTDTQGVQAQGGAANVVVETNAAVNVAGTAFDFNGSLNNKGTISTTGNSAQGARLSVYNNKLDNTGSITTSGVDSNGVLLFDTATSVANNNGTVATSGAQADAIEIYESFDNIVTNNGLLSTTGNGANGIFVHFGHGNQVINNGKIVTSGDNANGIYSSDAPSSAAGESLTNNGSIATVGSNSHGYYETGSKNAFTNNGTIAVTGVGSDGIRVENSADSLIINGESGSIIAQQGNGITLSGNTTAGLINQGVVISDVNGVVLTDNARASVLVNDGVILGQQAGVVLSGTAGAASGLINNGIIGTDVTGDAIRIGLGNNVSGGVVNNATGIIIGRLDAPTTAFTNNGTVLLRSKANASQVGSFTQSPSGTFGIEADNATSYGRMSVEGDAALNGRTYVLTTSDNFASGDVLQDVVTASTITGTPTVIDNNLRYNFESVQTNSSYSLRVVDTGLTTVTQAVGPVAVGVGGVLDKILLNPSIIPGNTTTGVTGLDCSANGIAGSGLAAAACGITSASNAQQVHRVAAQLVPLMNGSMQFIEMNNLRGFGDIVSSRQDAIRDFGKLNEFNPEKYLWIRPFGRWDNQQARDGVEGYKADTRGLAIGADAPVTQRTRAGMAVGFSRTDVADSSSDIRHDAQIESWNLLAYGSFDFTPDTALTLQAGYGRNQNKGNRYITVANPSDSTDALYSGVARSDYDSHNAQAGIGLQSLFRPDEKWSVTPSLRTDYYRVKDKGYQEDGASDLNLAVDGRTAQALIVSSRAKLAYQLSEVVSAHAVAGVGYDTINDDASVNASFAEISGTQFTTHGIKQSPWIGMAGVGVSAKFSDVLDGTIDYAAEQRSDFTSQGIYAKVRYAF